MSTQKIKIYDKINNFNFNLELKRRMTIIRGDSATKKSYLADLIRRRKNMLGKIIVESERTIHYIPYLVDIEDLKEYEGCILIFDEHCRYGRNSTEEKILFEQENLTSKMLKLDIYYIFITREDTLLRTYYSPYEVYYFEQYKKSFSLKPYFKMDMINSRKYMQAVCEDSGIGYQFFNLILPTKTLNGNGNFHKNINLNKLHFIDLANYSYFPEIYRYAIKGEIDIANIESFEWLVLQSSMFKSYRNEIDKPQDYGANDIKYLTWEQYYTDLLRRILKENNAQDYGKSNKCRCILEDCYNCSDKCALYLNRDKIKDILENADLKYLIENNPINKLLNTSFGNKN